MEKAKLVMQLERQYNFTDAQKREIAHRTVAKLNENKEMEPVLVRNRRVLGRAAAAMLFQNAFLGYKDGQVVNMTVLFGHLMKSEVGLFKSINSVDENMQEIDYSNEHLAGDKKEVAAYKSFIKSFVKPGLLPYVQDLHKESNAQLDIRIGLLNEYINKGKVKRVKNV